MKREVWAEKIWDVIDLLTSLMDSNGMAYRLSIQEYYALVDDIAAYLLRVFRDKDSCGWRLVYMQAVVELYDRQFFTAKQMHRFFTVDEQETFQTYPKFVEKSQAPVYEELTEKEETYLVQFCEFLEVFSQEMLDYLFAYCRINSVNSATFQNQFLNAMDYFLTVTDID